MKFWEQISYVHVLSDKLSFLLPYGHMLTKMNKRPMSLDVLLENQLRHLPKHHIDPFSTPWVEIELIFTLGAAVSVIQADFQHCHICV